MAATLQPPQANSQLKRLVYSKYREMLGSYNDKANTIIQSLPSYLVTEDRGFNFDDGKDGEIENNGCGAQPPACVQNAMMTKDKKPFTYTPGGIDLSEIKSPRMAKRIARNAQFEGVTGQPKPSPLAQQTTNQQALSAVSQPLSHGMPVQVFPSPPPPPPPGFASKNGPPPPPPPQLSNNQLKPHSNGTDIRKSPSPQNFEPPPLGCRPEIKIPPNPMASLKKVPKPKEKNDFWIEEYRKDRSSSPLIGASTQGPTEPEQPAPTPTYLSKQQQPSYVPVQTPQQYRLPSPPKQQYQEEPYVQQSIPVQQSPQKRIESPFTSQDSPNLQRPLSPIRATQQQQPQSPQQQQQQQRQPPPSNRWQSPTVVSQQQQPQQQQQQLQQSQQQRQPQQQQWQPQQQTMRNAKVGSLYIPPVAPENLATGKQQQQQEQDEQQLQNQVPVTGNPATPRWLAQKPNMKEIPEWVRDEDISLLPGQRAQAVHSPPNSASPSTPAPVMNFQIAGNAPNAKERIIPIQLEQVSTATRAPGTPGFGPQPFYNSNQQFSSVSSPSSAGSGQSGPGSGSNTPNVATRNPNQFVDQGYNNYQWPASQHRVTSPPAQQQLQQQQQQPTPQPSGIRVIPIAIEGRDNPFNNNVKGPIPNSPTVIQNDPRTLQHQNSWNNGAPNQSKSFRILQKITDTEGSNESENDQQQQQQQQPQIQRPLYSRQMGASAVDSPPPTEQMRRMQLNDQDKDYMNRVKNTAPIQRPQPPRYVQQRPITQQEDPAQPYIHPSEQQVPEPKKYMGSAIPSRSFKILQAMTTPENAGPGQSDL